MSKILIQKRFLMDKQNKFLGNGLKLISVANSTLVGAGLMGGEKMEAIPHALEVGAGAGLILGSLAMYGVGRLESKKQVFPILVITGLLATTYPYSAPALHKIMLNSELGKIEYDYKTNTNDLKTNPKYIYNRDKQELLFKQYNSLKPNIKNKYKEKIKDFQANYQLFIDKKYKELANGKYKPNGHKTEWYRSQVKWALANNYKNIEVGYGLSFQELKKGKKDLVIDSIAKIFFYAKLRELKNIEKEEEQRLLKESNTPEIREAYNNYVLVTKDEVLKMRANIKKLIENDLKLANSKIYKEEEIEEVLKIIGVIVEMILTPFMMWLSLLEDIRLSERLREWRMSSRTKEALIEAKEEVLIDTLDSLLKKHNLKMTLELKRVLFLVQNIMNNDLNKLSKDDFMPKQFDSKYGSTFPKEISLKNKNQFYTMIKFIEYFKKEFATSKVNTTADILYVFAEYKKQSRN